MNKRGIYYCQRAENHSESESCLVKRFLNSFHSPNSEFFEVKTGFQTQGGSKVTLSAIFFAKKINAEGWDSAGGNTTPAGDDNGIPETPKGFEERSERRHKVTQ